MRATIWLTALSGEKIGWTYQRKHKSHVLWYEMRRCVMVVCVRVCVCVCYLHSMYSWKCLIIGVILWCDILGISIGFEAWEYEINKNNTNGLRGEQHNAQCVTNQHIQTWYTTWQWSKLPHNTCVMCWSTTWFGGTAIDMPHTHTLDIARGQPHTTCTHKHASMWHTAHALRMCLKACDENFNLVTAVLCQYVPVRDAYRCSERQAVTLYEWVLLLVIDDDSVWQDVQFRHIGCVDSCGVTVCSCNTKRSW